MPPKVKVTKEEIVHAAVDIVRKNGAQALNARTVAGALGCSTQPVFSNFESMEQLFFAAVQQADALYQGYIAREVEQGAYPPYKASGMAYIRFAKEEKELFKLLFMRDRTEEQSSAQWELGEQVETILEHSTGLHGSQMKLFHLQMWAVVHGIATMFATGFLNLDWTLVSNMLTDAYRGLRKQYNME